MNGQGLRGKYYMLSINCIRGRYEPTAEDIRTFIQRQFPRADFIIVQDLHREREGDRLINEGGRLFNTREHFHIGLRFLKRIRLRPLELGRIVLERTRGLRLHAGVPQGTLEELLPLIDLKKHPSFDTIVNYIWKKVIDQQYPYMSNMTEESIKSIVSTKSNWKIALRDQIDSQIDNNVPLYRIITQDNTLNACRGVSLKIIREFHDALLKCKHEEAAKPLTWLDDYEVSLPYDTAFDSLPRSWKEAITLIAQRLWQIHQTEDEEELFKAKQIFLLGSADSRKTTVCRILSKLLFTWWGGGRSDNFTGFTNTHQLVVYDEINAGCLRADTLKRFLQGGNMPLDVKMTFTYQKTSYPLIIMTANAIPNYNITDWTAIEARCDVFEVHSWPNNLILTCDMLQNWIQKIIRLEQ